MSDQDKSQTAPTAGSRDPVSAPDHAETGPSESATGAAAAALALAVKSARKAAGETVPAPVRDDAPLAAAESAPVWRRYGTYAATAAVTLALGSAAGWHVGSGQREARNLTPAWAEAANAGIRQNQANVVRLAGDVKVLKATIESLKEGLERGKGETAKQTQVIERLGRMERSAQDSAKQVGQLAEAVDRLDRLQRDPARLAPVSERLDRIEKQVTAAAATITTVALKAPAASVPEPTQTGTVAVPKTEPPAKADTAAKPDPRTTPVEGWVLREVYDGVALIEGRDQRLHEVGPGEMVPGLGRVEAIERRGKKWVVLTAKGVIGTAGWQ